MNSPGKNEHQVLGTLPVGEIKAFLLECANLPNPIDYPGHRPHFDRWLRRWRRIFTFDSEGERTQISSEQLEQLAPSLRTVLRRIWSESDARQRDWYFYRLRDAYHRMMVRAENSDILEIPEAEQLAEISRARGDDPNQRARFYREQMDADYLFDDAPGVCPFEATIYWLQANQRLMLHCGGPMCSAPYFFRTEKGQRFCSPECADPARREAKLRWWNESPNSPKNRKKKKTKK